MIESNSLNNCFACGSYGSILYNNIEDRVFKVPGEWNFLQCQNRKCGLIWLDTDPNDIEFIKAYKNYYTHKDKAKKDSGWLRRWYYRAMFGYGASRYNYNLNNINFLDKLFGFILSLVPTYKADFDYNFLYLGAKHNGKLLEIGCGSGEMLKNMFSLGWNVVGTDIDPEGVKNARAKGLSVHIGKLEHLNYTENSVDAIVLSHTIEHVNNPKSLFAECFRILKPGGNLIAITPNTESWGHDIFKENWRGLEPPRHLFIYNRSSLKSIVSNTGFKIVLCRSKARARFIFSESYLIRQNKKSNGIANGSIFLRIWSMLMEILESIYIIFRNNKGEELVLVATK
jgi:2-polyprenyl-3-methyl-5-hydroxy-6-metoxy-1,4-benzoquinol methylase